MFCFIPLVKIEDPDLDNAYAIDDSYCGDPFESSDGHQIEAEHKILLRQYSPLTERYHLHRGVAYSVSGLIGLYQQRLSDAY